MLARLILRIQIWRMNRFIEKITRNGTVRDIQAAADALDELGNKCSPGEPNEFKRVSANLREDAVEIVMDRVR